MFVGCQLLRRLLSALSVGMLLLLLLLLATCPRLAVHAQEDLLLEPDEDGRLRVQSNICALTDPQMALMLSCVKPKLNAQLIEEWDSKLATFGSMSEVEIVRMVCKGAMDAGNMLVDDVLDSYIESVEERNQQSAYVEKCVQYAFSTR